QLHHSSRRNRMSTATTKKTTWVIDPAHTTVEFAVKHMMVTTVRGRFGQVSGTIELDEEDLTRSSAEVTIPVASIDTREEQRDAHLRSADFFDAENHPNMTFRTRSIEQAGEDEYRVTGDLTIRGVTREVVLDARLEGRAKKPTGEEVIGLTASTSIDREDYGLKWNVALEAGGWLVGKEVRISLDVQAIRQDGRGRRARRSNGEFAENFSLAHAEPRRTRRVGAPGFLALRRQRGASQDPCDLVVWSGRVRVRGVKLASRGRLRGGTSTDPTGRNHIHHERGSGRGRLGLARMKARPGSPPPRLRVRCCSPRPLRRTPR